MTPEDPRHGTHAGAVQHWKDGERPCDACRTGTRRARKARTLQRLAGDTEPRFGPLGAEAYRIIQTCPRPVLAERSGLGKQHLVKLARRGPDAIVHRDTRTAILSASGGWTAVGIARRLQALGAIGWAGDALMAETGLALKTISRLRSCDQRGLFIREVVALAVIDAYDRLAMNPPPPGRGTSIAKAFAKKAGWAPPLAWTNIDDPDEQPDLGDVPRNAAGRPMVRDALIEDAEWMADAGEHLGIVCERLGVTRDNFHQACRRAERLDLYHRLARRDPATGEMSLAVKAAMTRRGAA